MDESETAPIRAYCRGCRVERRFVFAAWATETGAENTVRPRAEIRRCATCGRRTLVLADVTDGEALVDTVIEDWRRSHHGDTSGLDLADARGMLSERLWLLYLDWRPSFGDGRVTFHGYAIVLLRKKLLGWIGDHAGGIRSHRNGHGRDALRYPKAHSLAVSESYDAIVDGRGSGGFDVVDRPSSDLAVPRRLEFALGAFSGDATDDRTALLGGILDR